MEKWPAWSAPLLVGAGGGLAGAALLGDPHFPFPPFYTILSGAALGMFTGSIVWAKVYRKSPPRKQNRNLSTSEEPRAVSRWIGLGILLAGLVFLIANHTLVIWGQKKSLLLVLGGSLFTAFGLTGILAPNALFAGKTGDRLPLYVHVMAGLLAIWGFVLGFYLWLVVYK